jgi:radical SAM superfamily enzyme YgiQ (UPF0313 family)
MRVLMILPALTEAKSPYWRPIKYSLFPPLGLATLAAYLDDDDQVKLIDEHVMPDVRTDVEPDPPPDLVIIQAYITSAFRAYRLADHFRAHGSLVAIGGLHPTSLPDEAAAHADVVFLGPGEHSFPKFLADLRAGGRAAVRPRYDSSQHPRDLIDLPPIRRDLIRRELYFVPNSIVVTRGCPHHCTFCYKDAFFQGGRSFYTQPVDRALSEIERLPGRHLYFLDDHLLGDTRFAIAIFDGLRGMNRLFQGAATIDSVLRGDLIERAARAGLRSLFVGFESLSESALRQSNKRQNLARTGARADYEAAIRRLSDLGIMINGSFVFGLDSDDTGVFDRTVDWAVSQGLTTATFHIATPYPGTAFFEEIAGQDRLLHRHWDLYDTRQAVFQPASMSVAELEDGYRRAYHDFYTWANIARSGLAHGLSSHALRQLAYSAAWKKFEPAWNALIKFQLLGRTRSGLEAVLRNRRDRAAAKETESPGIPASAPSAHGEPRSIPLPVIERAGSVSLRPIAPISALRSLDRPPPLQITSNPTSPPS